MPIQNTDKFLVSRNNINYQTEAQDIMAIQDADLLLVERDEQIYKVEGTELKDYASSDIFQIFKSYTPPFSSTQYPQYGNMQASENCICALMNNGIWRSTDGINWEVVSQHKSRNIYTYNSSYIGGPQGIAYGGNGIWLVLNAISINNGSIQSLKSIDDGLTWTQITLPSPGNNAFIAGAPGNDNSSNFMIASDTSATIYSSTDGGITWDIKTTFPVQQNIITSDYAYNIAGATINGNPIFGTIIRFSGPGAGGAFNYITTNLGESWTKYESNESSSQGSTPTGIGGGNGAISFFGSNGVSGDNIAFGIYYDGNAKPITLSGGFDNPGGGNTASATTSVSGGGKIIAVGYKGNTQFVDISLDLYSSYSQSNLTTPASAAVYFKNRFYYFNPYSTKIAYT